MERDGISVKEHEHSDYGRVRTFVGLDRKTGLQYQHQISMAEFHQSPEIVVHVLNQMRSQFENYRRQAMGTDWIGSSATDTPKWKMMNMSAGAASAGSVTMNTWYEDPYRDRQMALDPRYGRKPVKRFNRLNQIVELDEGAKFEEPLDKLRHDVFKWLGR